MLHLTQYTNIHNWLNILKGKFKVVSFVGSQPQINVKMRVEAKRCSKLFSKHQAVSCPDGFAIANFTSQWLSQRQLERGNFPLQYQSQKVLAMGVRV